MTFKISVIAKAVAVAICLNSTVPAFARISGDTVRIGIITDMSGLYSDIDGQGGVEAIRMAIADFGGAVNGRKIELLYADHQNKADIAAGASATRLRPERHEACAGQVRGPARWRSSGGRPG